MITSFEKFVYRIPFYPLEVVTEAPDMHDVDAFITSFFMRKEFREAVCIASPEFLHEIDIFLAGEGRTGNKLDKFRNTALKYIVRMASRATPFGLFSGCGVGTFGQETQMSPVEGYPFLKRIRLDMGLLTSFAEFILGDPALRTMVRFYPNNTIYRLDSCYRYVEFNTNGGDKLYNLSSFEGNEYIESILQTAGAGTYIGELTGLLLADDIDRQEALDFVNELVDAKILVSELEPQMIGREYHQQVFELLQAKLAERAWEEPVQAFLEKSYATFVAINEACARLADATDGEGAFKKLLELCQTLDRKYPVKHYLQTDSVARDAGAAQLPAALSDEIVDGLGAYTRFCLNNRCSDLIEFKKKFVERYEGRMVRLVEVLDPETGLGYGNNNNEMLDLTPFVDDLPVGYTKNEPMKSLPWKAIHTFLLGRIMEAAKAGSSVIELTAKDIEALPNNHEFMPPTFNAFVSLSQEKGRRLVNVHHIGSTSAACLLGRFGFPDPRVAALIDDITAYEAEYYGDKVVAEINHLSESRAGNVMLRTKSRAFEICYLTKSNIVEEGRIDCSDLYLLCRDNKLVLYSRSLGKEVIPRLSNAHNYSKDTLPVYRFLSAFQENEVEGYVTLVFDIGNIPLLASYIPRIMYKNLVFWPATWYMETAELRPFLDLPEAEIQAAVTAHFRQKGIPTSFYITNREYDLFIDLRHPQLCDTFLKEIKAGPKFVIKEHLASGPGESIVANGSGSFLHELIIPYKLALPVATAPAAPMPAIGEARPQVKRNFFPGEEWVYLKIYAGVKTSEKLLRQEVPALLESLKREGAVAQWFFIRYSDPGFHLRLRVRLSSLQHYNGVMEAVRKYFHAHLESGIIKKIQLDTYARELERYEDHLIGHAESLFHFDSEFCLTTLQEIHGRGLRGRSWLFAFAVMDRYMEAFQLSEGDKYEFVREARDGFAVEFRANKMQRRHLSNKFRAVREELDRFLEGQAAGEEGAWFRVKTDAYMEKVGGIYAEAYRGLEPSRRKPLLKSLLHMFVNRFFASKNRQHEYVLYALMEQYYRHQIGKNTFYKHAALQD